MERFRQEKALQKALDGLRQLSTTIRSSGDTSTSPQAARCEESASNAPTGSPVNHQALVTTFREQLREGRTIDMGNLRCLAHNGCPDSGNLRAVAWKVLLGYLPPDMRQWDACLQRKRSDYQRFCRELLEHPHNSDESSGMSSGLQEAAAKLHADALCSSNEHSDDHPLNMDTTSRWHSFFQDSEIKEQIDRDVLRTRAEMHFFSGTDHAASLNREMPNLVIAFCSAEIAQEMSRALFIFAKLNPGLQYVQGMNELLAPLYWLCRGDVSGGGGSHAEADSWHLFVALISEFRDHFCKQLDYTQAGIKATLGRLSDMLKEHDRELWYHLSVKNKVDPQFYAFRWVTLLLTQEFEFPELLRLWDALLSDPAGRPDMLLRLCLAMLLNVREELLKGDFGANVKLLQRYPQVEVGLLLHMAGDAAQDSPNLPDSTD